MDPSCNSILRISIVEKTKFWFFKVKYLWMYFIIFKNFNGWFRFSFLSVPLCLPWFRFPSFSDLPFSISLYNFLYWGTSLFGVNDATIISRTCSFFWRRPITCSWTCKLRKDYHQRNNFFLTLFLCVYLLRRHLHLEFFVLAGKMLEFLIPWTLTKKKADAEMTAKFVAFICFPSLANSFSC